MSGTITGRVLDATGAPLAGATVALTSETTPVSDIASLTDAEGGFRRSGLDAGAYTVEVIHQDHPVHREPVEIADGQQVELEVQLGV